MLNKSLRLSRQVVGNVGLFYVCYRLCRLGWNAMPTSRNARGVDVVIYSQGGVRKITLQVKALSKRDPVPLGNSLENLISDFVVVCNNIATENPKCFILTAGEVRTNAHEGLRDGRKSYWLNPAVYHGFEERWDRIGDGLAGVSGTESFPR